MCDPLTPIVMKTVDCFELHDFVLNNDDDDIQDAYYKLYKFCMKSLKSSTKLKAKFQKIKLEKDESIAKLDETNKLNENLKINFHFTTKTRQSLTPMCNS